MEPHGEAAVLLLLDELVRAAIPDLDRAGAVLTGRDLALEVGVVERVILDVHRQVPLAGRERHPLRDGPAREHPVALEPEVVVQPARGVALDDEPGSGPGSACGPEWLRRPSGVALAPVGIERHPFMMADRPSTVGRQSGSSSASWSSHCCRPGHSLDRSGPGGIFYDRIVVFVVVAIVVTLASAAIAIRVKDPARGRVLRARHRRTDARRGRNRARGRLRGRLRQWQGWGRLLSEPRRTRSLTRSSQKRRRPCISPLFERGISLWKVWRDESGPAVGSVPQAKSVSPMWPPG